MRTTLDIDGKLLKEAMNCSKARTKTQAVEQGLRELIDTSRRMRLAQMGGKGYGMTLKRFLKSRSDE